MRNRKQLSYQTLATIESHLEEILHDLQRDGMEDEAKELQEILDELREHETWIANHGALV